MLLLNSLKYYSYWISPLIVFIVIFIPLTSFFYFYDLDKGFEFSNYITSITFFSFYQSLVSALLSVIIGTLFAYLLFKHNYIYGFKLLINSLSVLFVLPTIITIFGILTFYGNFFQIYGLFGILIAHVILNIPLVARVIFQTLNDISPNERILADQMNLKSWGSFLAIEWPVIKKNIPSLFVLISFICFVSFTPVLILGGGPKYSTLEVAIYHAVMFADNFNIAFNLLIVQILICGSIYFIFFKNFKSKNFIIDDQRYYRSINSISYKYIIDYLLLIIISVFIFSPIAFILIKGINIKILEVLNSFYFWSSLSTTFVIGVLSGALSIILTYGNLVFLNKNKNSTEFWFYSLIIFSPGILAVGYYIFFNQIIDSTISNIFIIIIINSIITLPFSYNYLSPSFFRVSREHHDISESINIYGLKRLFFIDWPRLKEPIITAFCVSSILSASDLVIISFFGTNDLSTLTQTIYRLMGSYRMDEAYAVSLLLLIYCFMYFILSYKLIFRKWNT